MNWDIAVGIKAPPVWFGFVLVFFLVVVWECSVAIRFFLILLLISIGMKSFVHNARLGVEF